MRKYTANHEWVDILGNSEAKVGITNYMQEKVGDVVFVNLPAVGKKITEGARLAVVESVKVAVDVYAPLGGEVVAINEKLIQSPETVNASPEDEGWFFKVQISNPMELNKLMDERNYLHYLEEMNKNDNK